MMTTTTISSISVKPRCHKGRAGKFRVIAWDPQASVGAALALNDNRRMPARLSAFVIWALVAASAVFWGLRLIVRSPEAPPYTVSVGDAASVSGDLTRLLGTPPVAAAAVVATPEIASRFRLTGVMAPKPPATQGVALIAVDGKLPRAFRVGAAVDGELVLQSVSLRTAAIGPPRGATAVTLELPPLPAPATGSLPPPDLGGNPAAPQPAVAAPPMARPTAPMQATPPMQPSPPMRRSLPVPVPQNTPSPGATQ
jgi:general secretion pathway protein C